MKRLFIAFALLLGINAFAQVNKVAILDIVDRDNHLEYNSKLMLRSYISEAVATTKGFETYEFTDLGETINQYEFRRTGNLSADDIRKIGQLGGIQQILVVEVSKIKAKQLFITAKLFNAETAQMEMTANRTTKTKMEELRSCATMLTNQVLRTYIEKSNPDLKKIKLVRNTRRERRYEDKMAYSFGDKDMTEEEMFKFVYERDPETYKKLKKARDLKITGWVFGGISAMCALPLYVPMLTEGYKQFDQAIKEFNRKNAGE